MPSSGADTGSDTSDNELRNLSLNTKEIKDFDWNRSASSSSRSRSKSSRQNNHTANLTVLTEQQRVRPLSISSETNNKEDTTSLKQEHQSFNMRTKSLAEEGNIQSSLSFLNQNKQYLSVSSSNSNDHLSTNFNSIGKSLSVEHRIANMSQMSINSQLSKNNSLRFPNRPGACDTPIQHYQHSTTPTPRESIVFNRGDEKPIAKILLSQHNNLKSQNSAEFNLNNMINQQNSLSSNSSSPRLSLKQENKQTLTDSLLFNQSLIDSKLKPIAQQDDIKLKEPVTHLIDVKSKSLKSLDSTLSLTSLQKQPSNKTNSDSLNDDTKSVKTSLQENLKSLSLDTTSRPNDKQQMLPNEADSMSKSRRVKKKKHSSQIGHKGECSAGRKKQDESFSTNNKLKSTKACSKCCTIV